MNNQEAQTYIDKCLEELQRIYHLVEGHGGTSPIVPFLTNYSIVKACGTIEVCFKTIIADAVTGESPQISNYIDHTVRNTSKNPSRNNIHNTLKMFDHGWNDEFKDKLNGHEHSERIKNSIDSLNSARNSFAHGDPLTSSFEDIRNYFNDAIIIMEILDEIVS